jgi:hypothetical protein
VIKIHLSLKMESESDKGPRCSSARVLQVARVLPGPIRQRSGGLPRVLAATGEN